jgi:hypothetical protein
MAERSILDVAKALKKYAPGGKDLNIGEHPALGGVGSGHSPTGYHYTGEAIDVRDWRPDVAPAFVGGKPVPWKERTGNMSWRAKQLGLFDEALGPGDKGHDTHVHLALKGKRFITDNQLEWLATGRYKNSEGKLTDVMPGSQVPTGGAGINEGTADAAANKILAAIFGQQEKQPTLTEQLLGSMLEQKLTTKKPQDFLSSYMNSGVNPYEDKILNPSMLSLS